MGRKKASKDTVHEKRPAVISRGGILHEPKPQHPKEAKKTVLIAGGTRFFLGKYQIQQQDMGQKRIRDHSNSAKEAGKKKLTEDLLSEIWGYR